MSGRSGTMGDMALNVNRWLKYARARIDSAVGSGNESLDRLEAEQEAKRADKPWLASDSAAPTFDEARARIAWEADQQAKQADRHGAEEADAEGTGKADVDPSDAAKPSAPSKPTDQAPTGDSTPAGGPTTVGDAADPGPRSPQQIAQDAERETARLELEDRQRKSAERLDQIRQELGIEDTPTP